MEITLKNKFQILLGEALTYAGNAAKLAKEINSDRSTVYEWLSGNKNPCLTSIAKLCTYTSKMGKKEKCLNNFINNKGNENA